jgi:cobalt/nickel transport system permease protein
MHVPDGVLDPKVAAGAAVLGAAGLAFAVRKLRGGIQDRTTVLMGSMAAFLFAAQLVNFPLYPLPISGHLLGGVLASVLLGPWAGASVLGAVLLVQCFLFGDGGLTALGANFVNMGLVGSVGGYAMYVPLRRAIGGRKGILIGAMAAAWFSVILSSGAFAVELAASGRGFRFLDILGWMALVHAAIGVGEALITGMVLRFLLLTRPDLVEGSTAPEPSQATRWGLVGAAGLGIALAVAIFLAPLASEHPDGLEYVGANQVKFLPDEQAAPAVRAPMRDYVVPGLERWRSVATAAAGVAGTLVVFAVGLGMARVFATKVLTPSEHSAKVWPDAV